jgi:SAM-dependent methyltransferase
MAREDSVQSRITGFWSTVAPEYEAHGGNVPAPDSAELRAWVSAIRELLPPAPADVLDVATGTGFVALIAAGLGHRVTGIDLAEPMLAEARKAAAARGLAVRFELRDAVSPGLPAQSLDAIVCRHFLWTLREPETALRDWRESLRPGGRVVAIDGFWFREPPEPSEPDEVGLFDRYYTKETRAALPAMSLASPAPVAALFARAGFSDVAVSDLAAVHALAADPPSPEPWYVVTARR